MMHINFKEDITELWEIMDEDEEEEMEALERRLEREGVGSSLETLSVPGAEEPAPGASDGFEGIAGYEKEKKELLKLRSFLHDAKRYRDAGVRVPKAILLYGHPGVGKTVMVRAIADDGISTVELRAADCYGDDAAEKVVKAFAEAREKAPCVLLLDELDKIAGLGLRHDREESAMNRVLLQELDRLPGGEGVLVAATCNDVRAIGPALARSGRFDRMLRIGRPSEQDRKKILSLYLNRMSVPNKTDVTYLARLTSGRTCADIERIVNEAGIIAMAKEDPVITLGDVCSVMNRLSLHGAEKDGAVRRETAVHEAGHAVAGLILEPDSVYGASAISQGDSEGRTSIISPKDMSATLEKTENRIAIALAGRVAEREILGVVSMGCADDLQSAMMIAITLLQKLGAYGYEYLSVSEGGPVPAATMEKAAEILNAQDGRIAAIIRENRDTVVAIADALQKRGALSRDELLAFTGRPGERMQA